MYELDRHRALADRGSDAFHRVGSHIAGREHAGAAGLEQKRLSLAGPVRGLRQRWTGSDEPLAVPLDLRREPVGPRHRTDEAEHRRRLHCPLLPGLAVEDRKSTRLNSSHLVISYAVFCLKKKTKAKRK